MGRPIITNEEDGPHASPSVACEQDGYGNRPYRQLGSRLDRPDLDAHVRRARGAERHRTVHRRDIVLGIRRAQQRDTTIVGEHLLCNIVPKRTALLV